MNVNSEIDVQAIIRLITRFRSNTTTFSDCYAVSLILSFDGRQKRDVCLVLLTLMIPGN